MKIACFAVGWTLALAGPAFAQEQAVGSVSDFTLTRTTQGRADRGAAATPRLETAAVRAMLAPSTNWALQAQRTDIVVHEAVLPGSDRRGLTASVRYSGEDVDAASFGTAFRIPTGQITSALGEVSWNIDGRNALFGRVENLADDDLFPIRDDPLRDRAFRMTKLQAGYARHFPVSEAVDFTVGGSAAAFDRPTLVDGSYGNNSIGYTVFARLSLGG